MNKINTFRYSLIILAFTIGITFSNQQLQAQNEGELTKDIFLVVDSSKSMVGLGGGYSARNIFKIVKDEIKNAINRASKGDSVTLIRFGTDTIFYPTIKINSNRDKDKLINQLNEITVNDDWTYTADMIRNLSGFMNSVARNSKNKSQLAMIFSDAIDDPPPGNINDKYKLGNDDQKTSSCDNKESSIKNRYVFFFSINDSEISKALANEIVDCFPEIKIEQVLDPEYQLQTALTEARLKAEMNIIPSINLSEYYKEIKVKVKAGEKYDVNLNIDANKRSDGKQLIVTVIEQPNEKLFEDTPKVFSIKEGRNIISLTLDMPDRAKGEYNRIIRLSARSNEESFFFLPDDNNDILLTAEAIPLNFKERFRLPEYWIPLLILVIGLLYVLYSLIRYITFRPIFNLTYFEVEKRVFSRKESEEKTEVFVNLLNSENDVTTDGESIHTLDKEKVIVKYRLDIIKLDPGKKVFITTEQSESESDDELFTIKLPGIRNSEEVFFEKLYKGRNTKFKVDVKSQMRLKNKKGFRGLYVKNKSTFSIGKYSFYIENNLK